MISDDVEQAYDLIERQRTPLVKAVRSAVHDACGSAPALERAVLGLVAMDSSVDSVFRLLALPVHGALTGSVEAALPVCVLSRLWWAGAETLDDVMDRQFDTVSAGLSTAAVTVASTACLTLVPTAVIAQQRLSPALGAALGRELNQASIRAATGQLHDVADRVESLTWKQAITSYADKTGAAYGRDAAMAALLAGRTTEEARGWRVFGRLLGVLRQTANDRAHRSADEDTDLVNGTPTLLLAYAMETLSPAEVSTLARAHAHCAQDADARREVWDRLRRPDVADGYDQRITALAHKATGLIERLAGPSPHREVLRWMTQASRDTSRLARKRIDP